MVNSVTLIGRLTADPELRYTTSNKAVANFTLAVNRMGNEQGADFIKVVVWDKTAENVKKFVKKGSQIGVVGRIQTNTYQAQDGSNRSSFDIQASMVEFLDTKESQEQQPQQQYQSQGTVYNQQPVTSNPSVNYQQQPQTQQPVYQQQWQDTYNQPPIYQQPQGQPVITSDDLPF